MHRKLAEFSQSEVLRTVYLSLLDGLESRMSSVVRTGNVTAYLHERLAVHARIVDAVADGSEAEGDSAPLEYLRGRAADRTSRLS